MAGFIQNLLTDAAGSFFGSDYLRDYTHASKTFRTNSYQYAPKFKFLFHVYFDINTEAYPKNVGTGQNFGLDVKSIKLPDFSFDIHTMNQYNRKRIVQSKIKYDPINIAFHDDNGNMISQLWQAYYTYYYKDGSKPVVQFAGNTGAAQQVKTNAGGGTSTSTLADYNAKTTYKDSAGNNDWGYVGESSTGNLVKVPFFKSITVFGFNQHNFSAYTLINPVISKFSHDTYDYAQGNGTMENQMTLDYETVVYNTGAIDGRKPDNIVTGFGAEANYDRTVSPIQRPGANGTILGQGGLLDGIGGIINADNPLAALQAAGTTYNTFKNANITKMAKAEIVGGITNAIQQTPNRNINSIIPIFGATPQTSGTAGQTQGQSAPVNVGTTNTAGRGG